MTNDSSTNYYNLSANHPTLSDGLHNASFFANDTQGNANSSIVYFTVDTTAPTITIDSPINQTYSTGDIDYNITVSENLSIALVSIDAGANYSLTNDSSTNYYNLSGNHPTLGEGAHNASFFANDTSGNANSTIVYFRVDITSPTINPISPQNGTVETSSRRVNFTYNVSDNSTITNCSLILNGTINQTNTTVDKDVNTTFNTSLPNGLYYWYINCTDFANNTGVSGTNNITMSIPNNAPDDPSVQINSTFGTNATTDNLNCFAIITDPDPGSLLNVTVRWYRNNTLNRTNYFNNSYANATNFITTLASGNTTSNDEWWNCSIRLHDGIDYSNWVTTNNLTVLGDAAPTITIQSPLNISYPSGDIDYNITVSESLTNATVSIDSGTNYTMNNDSSNHYFNISGTRPTLSEGPHNATFFVNDTTGNQNSSTIYFTVDTTAPTITIDSPINQTYSTQSIWFNTTIGSAGMCQYSIDSGSNLTMSNDSTTHWFALNSSVGDGTHAIIFFCNDTYGNQNSSTIYFTVDTTAPTITIDSPINQTYSTQSIWFNTTIGSAGMCQYSIDSGTNLTMSNDSNTHWYILNSSVGDGPHDIIFFCNDTFGNPNSSTQYFTVDTTAPTLPNKPNLFNPIHLVQHNNWFSRNVPILN
jgi:hypothetical protein